MCRREPHYRLPFYAFPGRRRPFVPPSVDNSTIVHRAKETRGKYSIPSGRCDRLPRFPAYRTTVKSSRILARASANTRRRRVANFPSRRIFSTSSRAHTSSRGNFSRNESSCVVRFATPSPSFSPVSRDDFGRRPSTTCPQRTLSQRDASFRPIVLRK